MFAPSAPGSGALEAAAVPTADTRSFSNTDDVVVDDDDDAAADAATEDDADASGMDEYPAVAVFIDIVPADTKPLTRFPARLPAPRKKHKPYREDMQRLVAVDTIAIQMIMTAWLQRAHEQEKKKEKGFGERVVM